MVTDDDDGLQFCWDDSKAASNVEKHGVSFELATYVATPSERDDYEQNPFHS